MGCPLLKYTKINFIELFISLEIEDISLFLPKHSHEYFPHLSQ